LLSGGKREGRGGRKREEGKEGKIILMLT
jgi:hypothetical protein